MDEAELVNNLAYILGVEKKLLLLFIFNNFLLYIHE